MKSLGIKQENFSKEEAVSEKEELNEIISGNNLAPQVNLNMSIDFKYNCKVSISHIDKYAIAFAILEIFS